MRPHETDGRPGIVKQVTSHANPGVKLVKSLALRKARKETGLFYAEGAKVVAAARDAGWTARMFLFKEGTGARGGIVGDLQDWAVAGGAECLEVPDAILSKLVMKDNPQTVLGVFRQRWHTLDAVVPKPGVPWIVLENVRDPGNLGTIVRTADAAGAAGVVLVGESCDPYSIEAVRATMGSIFAVPIVRAERTAFLEWLASWPGISVGTALPARQDYRTLDYSAPTLLIMGNEGAGLSDAMAGACTHLVKIPMKGAADSLNLAIATALVLYEAQRRTLSL
ncbi:MAG TPA: RNA methyltransferase [Azospirillaceae bacterium]|nr:RNA methyltransferase [Azospirillaceae bacterium]